MSKRDNDIELIRKYLKGELSANAMHQLEKKALDDPFLMDALEGYEKVGGYRQNALTDLSDRLQTRIAKKERVIIPWKIIALAASVLIVIMIGGLLLFNSRNAIRPQIAEVVKPEKSSVAQPAPTQQAYDTIKSISKSNQSVNKTLSKQAQLTPLPPHQIYLREVASTKKEKYASVAEIAAAKPVADAMAKKSVSDTTQKDTTPADETIVMGYISKSKKDVQASTGDGYVNKATDRMLQGKVAGVTSTPSPGVSNMFELAARNIIAGKVIGENDGLPIVGASVRIAGTNTGSVTDINGNFNLRANSKDASLIVNFIGYQTAQVNATSKKDSIATIRLEPNNSSLSEVVVTGYGTGKISNAHPKQGWDDFNKYLKDNAVSSDGLNGIVKLSFQVDSAGAISDIKVVKSLSTTADQKAIDLIKNGPSWFGNSNGKPEEVKVRVKF